MRKDIRTFDVIPGEQWMRTNWKDSFRKKACPLQSTLFVRHTEVLSCTHKDAIGIECNSETCPLPKKEL